MRLSRSRCICDISLCRLRSRTFDLYVSSEEIFRNSDKVLEANVQSHRSMAALQPLSDPKPTRQSCRVLSIAILDDCSCHKSCRASRSQIVPMSRCSCLCRKCLCPCAGRRTESSPCDVVASVELVESSWADELVEAVLESKSRCE